MSELAASLQELREWIPFDKKIIKEQREDGRVVIVMEGILQRADTLNQNGRIYPRAILERELRNYQKLITERRALGALDHTDNSIIELRTASHVVTEATMDSDGVVRGRIEVLSTSNGKELQALVNDKITIGISSRGVGSTKSENGYQVVQEDFQLICWDVVSEPSTPGAFIHLTEGRINRNELNKFFKQSDRLDRIANEIMFWEKK
jgi:hypothetical protein